jgi:hypothetical protein
MSYRKFALVPYKEYQVMSDHKCVKNEPSAIHAKDVVTHDTDVLETKPTKSKHGGVNKATHQVTTDALQVPASTHQIPDTILYSQLAFTVKPNTNTKKRKTSIPKINNINKSVKVYNAKKRTLLPKVLVSHGWLCDVCVYMLIS